MRQFALRLTAAAAAFVLALSMAACTQKEVDAGYPTPTGAGTDAPTEAPKTFPILDGKNVNVDDKAAAEFSAEEIEAATLWTVENVKRIIVDESRTHEPNSRKETYTLDDFAYITRFSHPDVANKIGNWALPQWKDGNTGGPSWLYMLTITAPKDNITPRKPAFVPAKLIEDVTVTIGPKTSDGKVTLAVHLVTQTRSRFLDANQGGKPATGPLKRDVTYSVVKNADKGNTDLPWMLADWDGTFEFGNLSIDPNPDSTD